MLEQSIRKHYQHWLVDPVADRIHMIISPIHITLMSLIAGFLVIPALLMNHTVLAISFLLFSGYLDTLDGTVARQSNKTSALGSVCDIMADRTVEFSVIFGLWLVNMPDRSLMCILMLGSILLCITSFLVVGIFTPNTSNKEFYYSPGLIERAEAFIFFTLMILLPAYFTHLSCLFISLVMITTMVRLHEFKKYQTI